MRVVTLFILALLCAPLVLHPLYAAEEEGEKKEAPKEEKKEGGGEEGNKGKGPSDVSGGRFAGDPIYVHLAPMVLPVITENGAEQIVTLVIDVEVKDFDVADNIHSHMARVNDALVRNLYGGLSEGDLRNGKVVNIGKVKNRASAAIAEVVGKENIRDVLIQGIAQRIL